ncbi:MAG: caspase family protein [Ignavibacteriaceae bacterium]|nr:caspase family protein [Ignavibacteriaceae bacterium]
MNIYHENYNKSWALCIGINKYKYAPLLDYAANDAREFSRLLIDIYGFDEQHVSLLLDEDATRENIFKQYLSYSNKVELDDRIIIFYAGHGHTILGTRGEIGFLVPHDGNTEDLSSLLRWDDLTRNSELIQAKHMFFLLDACFSGLAITRALPRGSMRFVNDMLKRFSRQVIAAGKANQTVSDSGGPLPEHSIFTGYLINGLKGEAEGTDKIITANGLMSYLYEKVSKDYRSNQTPHFGYFDGDGDCILKLIETTMSDKKEGIVEDRLFEVPITTNDEIVNSELGFLDKIKMYISEPKYKIKIDDLITAQTKQLLAQITPQKFPLDESNMSEENIRQRLWSYENVTLNIRTLSIALSYWGDQTQKSLQFKIISRLSDHLTYNGGIKGWIALRWYPLILEMYSIGIPLIISQDYNSLYSLLNYEVTSFDSQSDSKPFILAFGSAISEINSTDVMKILKEHERHFVPFNEYLFKTLQPLFEDVLFIGKNYEFLFDRFEILISLVHADILGNQQYGHYRGPLGPFGYKYRSRSGLRNPVLRFKKEAFDQKDNWIVLKSGFFNSSFERFEKTFTHFEEILKKLNWY